jgi:hypothetical protein
MSFPPETEKILTQALTAVVRQSARNTDVVKECVLVELL